MNWNLNGLCLAHLQLNGGGVEQTQISSKSYMILCSVFYIFNSLMKESNSVKSKTLY